MVLLLFCAALFAGLVEANNVVPHLPNPEPRPELQTPLTLREPIHPGTIVWISGGFNGDYNTDIKLYVIAGGNGEYNDQMRACVLEIRANHDEDKISYGSLSKWGGTWNYAAESKNPIRSGYDFVLEFKDKVIIVWVNGQVLSIYSYSATIHNLSEITGIYIPHNDELKIVQAAYLSSSSFGSFPYEAHFEPPIDKKTHNFLISYGLVHCGEYAQRDVEYIFFDGPDPPKNYHFTVGYICKDEKFFIGAQVDGTPVGLQEKKYEASRVKNGMVMFVDMYGLGVKIVINGEELFDFIYPVDIEKYPITNLIVASTSGRYTMSILAQVDFPKVL